jgi:hypothetical protein
VIDVRRRKECMAAHHSAAQELHRHSGFCGCRDRVCPCSAQATDQTDERFRVEAWLGVISGAVNSTFPRTLDHQGSECAHTPSFAVVCFDTAERGNVTAREAFVRREYVDKEFTMPRASGLRILYADEKIGCDLTDPTTRRHQLWATRVDKHTTSLRAPFFWPLRDQDTTL